LKLSAVSFQLSAKRKNQKSAFSMVPGKAVDFMAAVGCKQDWQSFWLTDDS
jgi:hypothetical protein